jgi:IS5 family transposase
MFKVLILAAQNNVSDGRMEFLIRDRLSWLRFLGFALGQPTPDENTIRSFRERLTRAEAIRPLFELFDQQLRAKGCLAMGGQIVGASLISAPRQRNTRAEKEAIEAGKTARQIWPEHPHKAAQCPQGDTKRLGHRRALDGKGHQAQGSDKGLFCVSTGDPGVRVQKPSLDRFGFIRTFCVTDAARHEGRLLRDLVSPDNTASDVWADRAYRSKTNETWLAAKGRRSQIHHEKPKGKPMPKPMARANASKSAVRARVEHVLGTPRCAHAHQKERMGLFIRTIGHVRAEAKLPTSPITFSASSSRNADQQPDSEFPDLQAFQIVQDHGPPTAIQS